MRKYKLISALAEETAKEVVRNEESWRRYLKSREQSICFFLLCGYRKPRRLSDEQREQARLRMEKINSDDNCRED